MARLSDDGTMDTVIVCDTCGREHRFNYDPEYMSTPTEDDYHTWVEECIDEVDETCDHGVDEEES